MMIALLAVCLAVAVSAAFAWRHNPEAPEKKLPAQRAYPPKVPRPETSMPENPAMTDGRSLYEAKQCGTCHSINGVGNPRHPLDGVGGRLNAAELRDAITGSGSIGSALSKTVRQRKARYAEMQAEEMTSLIAYLSSLEKKEEAD